jgi:hypothetical protein
MMGRRISCAYFVRDFCWVKRRSRSSFTRTAAIIEYVVNWVALPVAQTPKLSPILASKRRPIRSRGGFGLRPSGFFRISNFGLRIPPPPRP